MMGGDLGAELFELVRVTPAAALERFARVLDCVGQREAAAYCRDAVQVSLADEGDELSPLHEYIPHAEGAD